MRRRAYRNHARLAALSFDKPVERLKAASYADMRLCVGWEPLQR